MRFVRRGSAAVLTLALLGLSGCGGGDDGASGASGTPSSSSTAVASADPTVALSSDPGLGLQPVAGMPSDFPSVDVPLLPGEVSQPAGAGDRERGWVLQVPGATDRKTCFDRAVAALVAKGFLLNAGPNTSESNIEALYLSPQYRVIVTASTRDQGCSVGYEVATNDPPAAP